MKCVGAEMKPVVAWVSLLELSRLSRKAHVENLLEPQSRTMCQQALLHNILSSLALPLYPPASLGAHCTAKVPVTQIYSDFLSPYGLLYPAQAKKNGIQLQTNRNARNQASP